MGGGHALAVRACSPRHPGDPGSPGAADQTGEGCMQGTRNALLEGTSTLNRKDKQPDSQLVSVTVSNDSQS